MYPSYLEYFRERDSITLADFDYDRNLFEFEQNSALPVLKGRLRSCLGYWHTIGANSFVIDTIKFGYRIPFISTPCQARYVHVASFGQPDSPQNPFPLQGHRIPP